MKNYRFCGHRPPSSYQLYRKRRGLFLRFFLLFGLVILLVAAGVGLLALMLVNLIRGDGHIGRYIWLAICGLGVFWPILFFGVARRAFQNIGTPLATIMAAADAVADGDLGVQVPEYYPAEFGQLSHSFNRMVRELQRADQQRRHLTADVAHELRTPLHIIQGNLEGILDGIYQPTAEHIGATLEETRLLTRLVDDLQTLTLAEAGQLPLKWEAVNLAELLADVQTSFSGQAEAAQLTLDIVLNGDPAQLVVQADRGRLDQVLGNLVANALRHTPPGGMITLQVEAVPEGTRLTVRDNGSGIPAEDLPYIFDRFWRGDRSRSHQGGAGSGLGLAISRQLVQAHGGSISAASQPGKETTFTIELPIAPKNQPIG